MLLIRPIRCSIRPPAKIWQGMQALFVDEDLRIFGSDALAGIVEAADLDVERYPSGDEVWKIIAPEKGHERASSINRIPVIRGLGEMADRAMERRSAHR